MNNTIIGSVFENSDRIGPKPAVITGNTVVTYRELRQKIISARNFLNSINIKRGDRIVLEASFSPFFVYGYLATHLIGAVAVPVDPKIPLERLTYILEKVQPVAVFSERKFSQESFRIYGIDVFDLKYGIDDDHDLLNPLPEDNADILFTTGTTGDPKGVVLTHRNIISAAKNINTFIKNTEEDLEVVPLPLSHSFGLGRLRCNLLMGGTIVMVDGFSYIGRFIKAIEQQKATGFSTVPTGIAMLFRMTKDKIKDFADQLKYIEIGSAPMPLEHKKKLMELLPHTRICMHYGLTEASRSTFIEFHESAEKIEHSIGKPTPNVQVKIVDKDFNDLPVGEKGRIAVKGDMTLKEYYKDVELTNEIIKNSFIDTGDIGFQDEDGYFYLDAREKEMINVGGIKVSPIEIEKLLVKHPSVKECACIGIPDPDGIMGEVVKAYLLHNKKIPEKPHVRELSAFLNGKIEPYKIPAKIEWIESIPKTTSGKIQRILLKQSIQGANISGSNK